MCIMCESLFSQTYKHTPRITASSWVLCRHTCAPKLTHIIRTGCLRMRGTLDCIWTELQQILTIMCAGVCYWRHSFDPWMTGIIRMARGGRILWCNNDISDQMRFDSMQMMRNANELHLFVSPRYVGIVMETHTMYQKYKRDFMFKVCVFRYGCV